MSTQKFVSQVVADPEAVQQQQREKRQKRKLTEIADRNAVRTLKRIKIAQRDYNSKFSKSKKKAGCKISKSMKKAKKTR